MKYKWIFLFAGKTVERTCSEQEDADVLEAIKQAKWLSIPGDTHYMINMEMVECIIREVVVEPVNEEFDLPPSDAELPPIDDQVA